jgi:hypothetical protein
VRNLFRLIGLVLLGMLLVASLLATMYAQPIEAALTLSTARTTQATVQAMTSVTPTKKHARGKPTVTPTILPTVVLPVQPTSPVVTPVPGGANILAQDTFQRADQSFWGTASNGQTWGADAGSKNVFSVAGGMGLVMQGQGTFDAVLGPMVADAEVQFSGIMSLFNQSNMGAVLRWEDTNDWYKAYIDGSRLVVIKKFAGIVTSLGSSPFHAAGGTSYTLRFRAQGTTLSAKAWPTGAVEPANWMVTVTDDTIQSGFGGLRFLLANGAMAAITTFKETVVP